jgi:hypothetical protein
LIASQQRSIDFSGRSATEVRPTKNRRLGAALALVLGLAALSPDEYETITNQTEPLSVR